MRKKSHILLARCLADNMARNKIEDMNMQKYRLAFCCGALVPDCSPSFLVQKHAWNQKSRMIEASIMALSEGCGQGREPDAAYWEKLGEVTHYVADFFTFPHNVNFGGSVAEHCTYEGDLKRTMKGMILSHDADRFCYTDVQFGSPQELIAFLRDYHAEYMQAAKSVPEDIDYIVTVTYQLVQGIVRLAAKRTYTIPNRRTVHDFS